MDDKKGEFKGAIYETCPHCGQKLSPWQQVLLGVDRAVMCKHCWYRIILSNPEESNKTFKEDKTINEDD